MLIGRVVFGSLSGRGVSVTRSGRIFLRLRRIRWTLGVVGRSGIRSGSRIVDCRGLSYCVVRRSRIVPAANIFKLISIYDRKWIKLTWVPRWQCRQAANSKQVQPWCNSWAQRSSSEWRTWWSCSRQQAPQWRSNLGPNSTWITNLDVKL